MPAGLNLKLENFSLTIAEAQIASLVTQAVEAANPEFVVKNVKFIINSGYAGDFRNAGISAHIERAEVSVSRRDTPSIEQLMSHYVTPAHEYS